MESFISLLNSDSDSSNHSNSEKDFEIQLYNQVHHSEKDFSNKKDDEDKKKNYNEANKSATTSNSYIYGERSTRKYTQNNFIRTPTTPATSSKYQNSNQTATKRVHNYENNEINMMKGLIQENYGYNSEIKISSYIDTCEKYLTNKKIKFTPTPKKRKNSKKINSKSHEQSTASDDDIEVVYDDKINQIRNNSIILNTNNTKNKKQKIEKKEEIIKPQHSITQLKEFINLGRVSCPKSWTEEMCQFYRDSWGDEDYNMDEVRNSMNKDPRLWQVLPVDKHWIKTPYNPDKYKRCYNCLQMNHISENCPEPVKKITCLLCGQENHKAKSCPYKICYKCLQSPKNHPPQNEECFQFYFCALCKDPGHSMEYCHLYSKMLNGTNSNRRPCCSNCSGAHWYEKCPDIKKEQTGKGSLYNRPKKERKRITSTKKLKRFNKNFDRSNYNRNNKW